MLIRKKQRLWRVYGLAHHSCRQAHCLNHLYKLNLGHLAPCSWEPVVISLNCLLLNMNSTNETLLFDRFLIMYDVICVFSLVLSSFLYFIVHMCECHMY